MNDNGGQERGTGSTAVREPEFRPGLPDMGGSESHQTLEKLLAGIDTSSLESNEKPFNLNNVQENEGIRAFLSNLPSGKQSEFLSGIEALQNPQSTPEKLAQVINTAGLSKREAEAFLKKTAHAGKAAEVLELVTKEQQDIPPVMDEEEQANYNMLSEDKKSELNQLRNTLSQNQGELADLVSELPQENEPLSNDQVDRVQTALGKANGTIASIDWAKVGATTGKVVLFSLLTAIVIYIFMLSRFGKSR